MMSQEDKQILYKKYALNRKIKYNNLSNKDKEIYKNKMRILKRNYYHNLTREKRSYK